MAACNNCYCENKCFLGFVTGPIKHIEAKPAHYETMPEYYRYEYPHSVRVQETRYHYAQPAHDIQLPISCSKCNGSGRSWKQRLNKPVCDDCDIISAVPHIFVSSCAGILGSFFTACERGSWGKMLKVGTLVGIGTYGILRLMRYFHENKLNTQIKSIKTK